MISASPLRNGSTSLKKAIDKDLPVRFLKEAVLIRDSRMIAIHVFIVFIRRMVYVREAKWPAELEHRLQRSKSPEFCLVLKTALLPEKVSPSLV